MGDLGLCITMARNVLVDIQLKFDNNFSDTLHQKEIDAHLVLDGLLVTRDTCSLASDG